MKKHLKDILEEKDKEMTNKKKPESEKSQLCNCMSLKSRQIIL